MNPWRRFLVFFALGSALLLLALFWFLRNVAAPALQSEAPMPSPAPAQSSPALLSHAARTKASSASRHPSGANAADLYKNAFALFDALTEEEKNILAHPRDEVDAEKAAALFEKIRPIIALLRSAKEAADCDWALGPVTFDKPMPQMNLAMKLGQLARWDAAYRFADEPSEAIADLAAQAQLGHRVSNLMIGFLVQASMSQGATELIRENASNLTPQAAAEAIDLLRGSPVTADFAGAMVAESAFPDSLAAGLADPKSHDQTVGQWKKMTADAEPGDLPDLLAQLRWLSSMEKDFASKAALPDAEFNVWWEDVSQQAELRPLANASLPMLKPMRERWQAESVHRAMLIAGLSAMQSGPEQLATIPDPTTGKPFVYVATPDGFELRSTFVFKKKPVTMRFPKPPR